MTTEAQLYEKIGRLQIDLEAQKADYAKLLQLLAWVVSGEIDVGRVLVNLTDQTYQWAAPSESPGLPATINGLPVCVVAPPPEEQPGFHDSVGPVTLTGRKLAIRRVYEVRPALADALNGNCDND